MGQKWQERSRPARLERRYEFAEYEELRDFLELAAGLSDKNNFYPNIGFGNGYVNFTIYPDEGNDELGENEREFAMQLEKLSDTRAILQA